MGNTQMEIGEAFNLSQNRIAEIIGKFNTKLFDILKIGIEVSKSFEEIARNHNLHPLTPYIKHLDDKNDEKKFEIFLEQNPRLYDIWNFQSSSTHGE